MIYSNTGLFTKNLFICQIENQIRYVVTNTSKGIKIGSNYETQVPILEGDLSLWLIIA